MVLILLPTKIMPVAAYRQDTYVVFNVDVYYFPTDRNGADFTTHQDNASSSLHTIYLCCVQS